MSAAIPKVYFKRPKLRPALGADLQPALGEVPFFDFVSVDSDVAVCGRLTEEDILSHVRHGDQQSEPDDANDEQDEEEEEEEPPRF